MSGRTFTTIYSYTGTFMQQGFGATGGRDVLTWDLPGGQVEPGEALVRELGEELGIDVAPQPEPTFLFYQEGQRAIAGRRRFVWRSFFFGVEAFEGEPRPSCDEVLAARWMPRAAMSRELSAPYHDSFVARPPARRRSCRGTARWDD